MSSSISTMAMCVPNGKVQLGVSWYAVSSRYGSMPSGVSNARSSANAISWRVFIFSGEPLTRYSLPSISMSSGLASSMCAA